jgi:MYXO-CTERM domain-containing protein
VQWNDGSTFCTLQCASASDCSGGECVPTNVWGLNVCGKPTASAPPPTNPPTNPPPPGTPTPNPDVELPKVTITSPAASALISSPVTVKATVTDNIGVARVDVLVNDAVLGSRTSAPYDFVLVLKTGLQLIKVVGHDQWGNKGEASITVTVQGSSPTPSPSPTAPGAGQFGDLCVTPQNCQSGMCALDSATQQQFCTQACTSYSPCPSSAECVGTSNGSSVCAPKVGSSLATPGKQIRPADQMTCSVGATTSLGDGLGGLLGLGLLLALRRRRR